MSMSPFTEQLDEAIKRSVKVIEGDPTVIPAARCAENLMEGTLQEFGMVLSSRGHDERDIEAMTIAVILRKAVKKLPNVPKEVTEPFNRIDSEVEKVLEHDPDAACISLQAMKTCSQVLAAAGVALQNRGLTAQEAFAMLVNETRFIHSSMCQNYENADARADQELDQAAEEGDAMLNGGDE